MSICISSPVALTELQKASDEKSMVQSTAYLTTSSSLGAISFAVDGLLAVGDSVLGALLHHQWPLQLLGNLLQLVLPVTTAHCLSTPLHS